MIFSKQNSSIRKLIDTLEHEQQIILLGQLDKLTELNKRKQSLVDGISKNDRLNVAELETLRNLTETNLRLITAARKGVQNVRSRLKDLERVTAGTCTYGSNGNRNQWLSEPPKKDISY